MSTCARSKGCNNCRRNANSKGEDISTFSKPPQQPTKSQKRSQLQEIFTKKLETVVSFQHQNITKVNRSEIEKYRKYLGLDFSHNTIDLTNDICSSFKYIKFLNLSNNQLTCLPQDVHLMENLAVLDVTNNKISKLPMNICKMVRLEWLDIRNNPFLTTWYQRKGCLQEEFNPQQFAFQLRSFMKAARDWRDHNLTKRVQELVEFLVICPPHQPSSDDADFDLTEEDYNDCPLYKMAGSFCELKKQVDDLKGKLH